MSSAIAFRNIIPTPLSLALAGWRSSPRKHRLFRLVGASTLTGVFFLLVTTSLLDHTESAWLLSRISGWFTLGGLLVCGCLTAVIARRQGAAI